MRLVQGKKTENVEMDMTPMIDMTFQLITFFMMLINFSQQEQDARVDLPTSALVEPAEETGKEDILTLQFTKGGTVLVMGDEVKVGPALEGIIDRERRVFSREKKMENAIVVIRADKTAATGEIQEAIDICQKNKFERFRFRVLEPQGG